MQNNNNPLSPHLQIYKWQISSLLSITHRIVGVINILAITLICIWVLSLLLGESNYEITQVFLKSFFGKFIIVFLCWTFSFHILNEIRHLVWDMGYGFDLKVTKITGVLAFVGSFVFTILFYLIGKKYILICTHLQKKWLFLKYSSIILIPLMIWFIINLASIYDADYVEVVNFFIKQPSKILFSIFIVIAYFFSALTISEIFEDYIHDEKIKNVANKMLNIFAIITPLLTVIGIFNLS